MQILKSTSAALLAAALCAGGVPALAATPEPLPLRDRDRGVDRDDRAWIMRHVVGFAPPAFADDLIWPGEDAPNWEDLRGRVALVQTWSRRDRLGRSRMGQIERLREQYDASDLEIIALHTPEGADGVGEYLDRRPSSATVAIDPSGGYCDRLGAWKRPAELHRRSRWRGARRSGEHPRRL